MRRSFFAFACLLLIKSSFAQTISYKDLIGVWNDANPSKKKFSINFSDTFHVIIYDANAGVSNGTYQLKTSADETYLRITLNEDGINHYEDYRVNFIKPGMLKFQSLDTYDPVDQILPLSHDSFFIVKKE